MRKPDFVIIGAMKCATSSLHEQLARQPGIFMSTPKEPNFFSDDDQFERGGSWYYGLYEAASDSDLCGESSTHYSKLPTYPETVERLQAALPEVRLIYIMRDPLERLVSQYIHEWTQRLIECPIDLAVERYPELIDYSCYAMQLRPYLAAFGPDRILPVFFESLRDHPEEELSRIARFLGYTKSVKWRDDVAAQNVSSERFRAGFIRDTVLEQPVLTWLRRRLVPQFIRDRVKQSLRMSDRPVLSGEPLAAATSRLDGDLAELGSWLGLELSCDSFGRLAAETQARWVEPLPDTQPA